MTYKRRMDNIKMNVTKLHVNICTGFYYRCLKPFLAINKNYII
jgi:hypothetical protein